MGLSQLIATITAVILSAVFPLTPANGKGIATFLFPQWSPTTQSAINGQQFSEKPATSVSSHTESSEKTFTSAPSTLPAQPDPNEKGMIVEPVINHGSSHQSQPLTQTGGKALKATRQTLDSQIVWSRPATKAELQIFDRQQTAASNEDTALIRQSAWQSRSEVTKRSLGVDVSSYQNTDLTRYARAGATFAIVKISESTNYKNPKAQKQIASAIRNRMQVDGYFYAHFSSNVNAARREATYAANAASQMGLPYGSYFAVDWESGSGNTVNGWRVSNTNAVLAAMRVLRSRGYLPLCYSGAYILRNNLNVNIIVNEFRNSIWVASYETTGRINNPDFHWFPSMNGVAIWQFTDNFRGTGADGNINVLPLNTDNSSQHIRKPHPRNTLFYSQQARAWFYANANGSIVRNTTIPILRNVKNPQLGFITTYVDKNGHVRTGERLYRGAWYLIDSSTAQVAHGMRYLRAENKWVHYDMNTGVMTHGEKYIADDRAHHGWYYFDRITGKMAHGVIYLRSENKWVYYDIITGIMAHGFRYLHYDGAHHGWYYFDRITGKMAHGRIFLNRHWYYFDRIIGIMR